MFESPLATLVLGLVIGGLIAAAMTLDPTTAGDIISQVRDAAQKGQ